ncbi:M48 family metallopeptidase [Pseudomonas sp. H1h]|uniref:M48 family metallopeptidase n=1 Tax=Pseudomonas sp. H1h TaxID=1397280 RepID=UPI00046A2829|nr:M48 family metallopeptidase [Pseudomonas sp. H1h]
MNFFQQQRQARHQTALLVALMIIAVLCLITLASLPFVIGVLDNQHDSEARIKALHTTAVVAMIVSGIVLLGSLFKYFQLLGGGKVIAEKLGGRPVNDDVRTADERRLMNVVEEMALASGVAIPAVYLLPDETINAFAAGFTPKDAVIGVTQGAISLLTREELQGVIAHEFSHIYNGDMLLNTRLVATVHGILVVGLAGAYLLFGLTRSKKSKKNDDGYLLLLLAFMGMVLCVAGFIGSFFANVIKAAVSRQREYLADASAVQFTRNPQGIAGALKKIGSQGSTLSSPRAKEFSHLYFSAGSTSFFKSLFATHPDLSERIRRIDPQWDGQFTLPPAQ